VSAKTRSWEQAERLAQTERDRGDPVKRKLQQIEEQEAQMLSLRKEKNITVREPADRWFNAQKFKIEETSQIHGKAKRRIWACSKGQGAENVKDVTMERLDKPRGSGGKELRIHRSV